MAEPGYVPLQVVSEWGDAANSILGAHCGTLEYLLPPQPPGGQELIQASYSKNEDVWRDLLAQRVGAGHEIVLDRFQVMNWFPRAPGLYHTRAAEWARQEAFGHLHPRLMDSPVRDHAARTGQPRGPTDYTVVFTPEGKSSMLQGGIGSVRLKPIRILGQPHWLMSASSDGVAHSGVPIAVPLAIYRELSLKIQEHGSVCCKLWGELDFLDDPFSRVFNNAAMVPRLYLKVTKLEPREPIIKATEVSVAVSFVSAYKGHSAVYATYVTFEPNVKGSFENAVSWMKNEYVEGEYRGRIITDFDQTRTTFPEAWLALSRVMDRLISRGTLRETIELMHATASVDAYFDEIDRRELLFKNQSGPRTKIFISYAHAAEKETGWVKRIRKHLESLIHDSDLEIWDDTRIEPGDRWKERISQAIDTARLAVLVLTADFLASKFIRDAELPLLLQAAQAGGATILCVYGSAVHLSGPAEGLLEYQFVNSPEEPLQALTAAARESVMYASLQPRKKRWGAVDPTAESLASA